MFIFIKRGTFMNQPENTDRRIRRTKALLTDAFLSLLKTKSFNDITVKELCETADVNRGTFYLHYKDIYEMMERLEEEIVTRFEEVLTLHTPEELGSDPNELLYDLFVFIAEHADLCQTLLGQYGDISFLMKIKSIFHDRFWNVWLHTFYEEDRSRYEYSYNFIVSGCIGLIETWLSLGHRESPEEMAALAGSIITSGIRSLM